MSIVFDLAASLLTGVLVWYDDKRDWGFSTDYRDKAGISSGRHPTGIKNTIGILNSERKVGLIIIVTNTWVYQSVPYLN